MMFGTDLLQSISELELITHMKTYSKESLHTVLLTVYTDSLESSYKPNISHIYLCPVAKNPEK